MDNITTLLVSVLITVVGIALYDIVTTYYSKKD